MIFGEKDMGKIMTTVMTVFEVAKGMGIILGGLAVIGSLFGIFIKAGKLLKTIEVLSKDSADMKVTMAKNQIEIKECLSINHRELKEILHEMNGKLDLHGNRLTAIETTLRLADYFYPINDKATN